MKISVIMPSRGRVRQLTAALISLKTLASEEHEILYGVACDDDDPATIDYLKAWRADGFKSLSYMHGPRAPSLGLLDNMLAGYMPADVYVVWGDDLLCCTHEWDKKIAEAIDRVPHGVFWWKTQDGSQSLVPIISEKWRAASGGLFTDYFPFWYDDIWLWELWQFTTDSEPEFLEVRMADKPIGTTRMRDLGFWARFYHAMRGMRIKEGLRIAAALGLPIPKAGQVAPEVYKLYTHMHPDMVKDVERRNHAETGEPDPQYVVAKRRAEEMLQAA